MMLFGARGPGMTPTAGRLSWTIQKYRHFVDSFVFRRSPSFIYQRRPGQLEDDIPVFTFHGVLPEIFESQCDFLSTNGYRTLSPRELLQRLRGTAGDSTSEVMLTFDDGLKHVWTVIYPLLKKYNLQGTCFLIPGCITEGNGSVRPNLEDVWDGEATEDEIVAISGEESPLATWPEIREMHESGVISFQSHTMHHALVPVSERVFDFVGPHYDPHFFCNVHIPLYRAPEVDVDTRAPLAGLPVFYARPRMQARRRFIPDQRLVSRCHEIAIKDGETEFFNRPDWRSNLQAVVTRFADREGGLGRYETREERDRAVRKELRQSRRVIEERLPGAQVTHLCYPWFHGGDFAVNASKEVGFQANYFGQTADRHSNRPGRDPYRIARMDEMYLERLPGKGRKSVVGLMERLLELRSLPARMFPGNRPGHEGENDER